MKQIALTTIALAIALFSFGQTEKQQSKQKTHNHTESELRLDTDGNKWQANPETTAGINNMEKHLNSFTEFESSEAYLALKADLEKEFSMIVQQCTMKGEAHDQLHNYIFPLREMIKELDGSDLETQKRTLKDIKAHISIYDNYFKTQSMSR